jgi:hypothetical protein
MSMNTRFTAWLSTQERDALKAKAKRLGTSENFILRLALRHFLGLPVFRETTLDEDKVMADAQNDR